MNISKLIQTVEGSWFVELVDDHGNLHGHLGPYSKEEAELIKAKNTSKPYPIGKDGWSVDPHVWG